VAARRKFTPYRPPTPPAGSYDPALDAQLAAARRGLSDLQGQIGTQQARDVTDYASQLEQIGRQTDYNEADLSKSWLRGREDIYRDRARGGEDYQRNVQMLTRRYDQLGRNQLQATNAAGVIRGGALLQSAAKRSENQALERQPLDTNYNRFMTDSSQAESRLGADYAQQSQRNEAARTGQLGRLALDYSPPDPQNNPLGGRRWQDRTTQLTQAQREYAFFGQDVGAAKAFQASGAGWDPPQKPSNEFVSAAGVPYQVRGGVRYDQYGRRLGRATGRGF